VVKIHAAEALLIVDGHCHLKDDLFSNATTKDLEKDGSFRKDVDQMQDPVGSFVSLWSGHNGKKWRGDHSGP
jgi:hypothetical protein